MRITNGMLIANMLTNISTNQVRMDSLQQKIATGKKIVVPSDDPIVAARSLKLRTDIAEVSQFKRNTADAISWLETNDSTLGKLEDVLQRVRELAVQGSNSVLTSDDTSKISEEIKQLKTQVIHIANTTYAGRYLFSGFKSDRKLVDDNPNSSNYGKFNISVGTKQDIIKFEIGIGDSLHINIPGGDLFNTGSSINPTSGVTVADKPITFPLVITEGNNDTLNLSVDGESVSVKIAAGTYNTEASVITGLQSKINEATTRVEDITVSFAAGKLQFTSGSTGPSSQVIVNGGKAVNSLGLSSSGIILGGEDGNAIGNVGGYTFGNEDVASLTINNSNDILQLSIDGQTVSITLDHATYPSVSALAEHIQGKINQNTSIAFPVSVSALGSQLSFKSGSFGETSKITIEGGNAVNNLGLSLTTGYYGTKAVAGKMFSDFDDIMTHLKSGDFKAVGRMIKTFDNDISNVLRIRADIGARQNRVEMTQNRLESDAVAFTKLMSDNEDIDMAETIMQLKNEENVYKASLAGGARIIQPTLMDFLR